MLAALRREKNVNFKNVKILSFTPHCNRKSMLFKSPSMLSTLAMLNVNLMLAFRERKKERGKNENARRCTADMRMGLVWWLVFISSVLCSRVRVDSDYKWLMMNRYVLPFGAFGLSFRLARASSVFEFRPIWAVSDVRIHMISICLLPRLPFSSSYFFMFHFLLEKWFHSLAFFEAQLATTHMPEIVSWMHFDVKDL